MLNIVDGPYHESLFPHLGSDSYEERGAWADRVEAPLAGIEVDEIPVFLNVHQAHGAVEANLAK